MGCLGPRGHHCDVSDPTMRIPLTTTTQLLDALRDSNNSDMWEVLVERYSPVLQGVARGLGLDGADAADAAQQTLMDMVRDLRAGAFDPRMGGLRRWTLGILRHRTGDILRKRRRERGRRAGLDSAVDLPDTRVDLDAAWRAACTRHIVAMALERLVATSRFAPNTLRAFELTVLRAMPASAASEECGMSVDEVYVARTRVASRLREIVERLRMAYEEDEA